MTHFFKRLFTIVCKQHVITTKLKIIAKKLYNISTYAFRYDVASNEVTVQKLDYYVVGTFKDADGNAVNFSIKEGVTPVMTVENGIASVTFTTYDVTDMGDYNWMVDQQSTALDSRVASSSKNDTMKMYMAEIAQISLVTKNDEAMLAKAIHGDNLDQHDEARSTLIQANLRLVVKIAHDFKGLGLPLLEVKFVQQTTLRLFRLLDFVARL